MHHLRPSTARSSIRTPQTPDLMTTSTQPATTCHLFKLPPEICNEIYSLVFTTAAGTEDVVYFTAEPPSKAIILTCKQAYREANEMYQHSYRRFWRDSTFKVPAGLEKRSREAIEHTLRDEDVGAITRAILDPEEPTDADLKLDPLILEGGLWTRICVLRGTPEVGVEERNIVVAKGHNVPDDTDFPVFGDPSEGFILDVTDITDPVKLQAAMEDAGRVKTTKHELLVWLR
ncbi:hypothetical protein LTR85_005627 [Meristemomyces frigidus]|nr:hypothetical protein LTR85_005627 [Meristemomyces frigidus]